MQKPAVAEHYSRPHFKIQFHYLTKLFTQSVLNNNVTLLYDIFICLVLKSLNVFFLILFNMVKLISKAKKGKYVAEN